MWFFMNRIRSSQVPRQAAVPARRRLLIKTHKNRHVASKCAGAVLFSVQQEQQAGEESGFPGSKKMSCIANFFHFMLDGIISVRKSSPRFRCRVPKGDGAGANLALKFPAMYGIKNRFSVCTAFVRGASDPAGFSGGAAHVAGGAAGPEPVKDQWVPGGFAGVRLRLHF